jgi:hypothetical protein
MDERQSDDGREPMAGEPLDAGLSPKQERAVVEGVKGLKGVKSMKGIETGGRGGLGGRIMTLAHGRIGGVYILSDSPFGIGELRTRVRRLEAGEIDEKRRMALHYLQRGQMPWRTTSG